MVNNQSDATLSADAQVISHIRQSQYDYRLAEARSLTG